MATKKKATKRNKQIEEQNRREVSGICLIALGLFLGASLYSDAVGLVGKAISAFFFGIFGLGGYAVPAAVVAFGGLLIIFLKLNAACCGLSRCFGHAFNINLAAHSCTVCN